MLCHQYDMPKHLKGFQDGKNRWSLQEVNSQNQWDEQLEKHSHVFDAHTYATNKHDTVWQSTFILITGHKELGMAIQYGLVTDLSNQGLPASMHEVFSFPAWQAV